MNGVLTGCGAALVGVFLSFILSAMGYRGGRLVSVAASVMLFMFAAGGIGEILSELSWISDSAGLGEIAEAALKIVGIGYVAGICYDICLDMGERGVASAVLTVGRVEILLVSTPVISDMLMLAVDMF